jgi:hypothetical protein
VQLLPCRNRAQSPHAFAHGREMRLRRIRFHSRRSHPPGPATRKSTHVVLRCKTLYCVARRCAALQDVALRLRL